MPKVTAIQNPDIQDPREQGPQPDFPQGRLPYPGSSEEMSPKPDHGEESYRGLGRLEGRTALITGGDSGIGRAVAIAFAREGADVAISYLPEEEKDAEETSGWIERAAARRCGCQATCAMKTIAARWWIARFRNSAT